MSRTLAKIRVLRFDIFLFSAKNEAIRIRNVWD